MSRKEFLDQPARYQLRVKGILDSKWASWFDGFSIEHTPGETILTGQVMDQAALYGILAKIRDLGLTILSVKWLEINYLEEHTTMTKLSFPKQFPEIETERMILRAITSDDTDAIFRNFSDPEISRWFFEKPLTDIEQARQFIKQFNTEFEQEHGLTWAITLKGAKACIGTCGYGYVEIGNQGEIGFDLAKEYWNQGIMAECLEAVIDYGFSHLDLLRVKAHTFSNNVRAKNLLEKIGFQLDFTSDDSHYYFIIKESSLPGSKT